MSSFSMHAQPYTYLSRKPSSLTRNVIKILRELASQANEKDQSVQEPKGQEIICKAYKLLGSEIEKYIFLFHSLYVVYKKTKCLRFRLAETEHEFDVRIPLAVGSRPSVVQPQTVVVAHQSEDERAANGVGDLLRAHINRFI